MREWRESAHGWSDRDPYYLALETRLTAARELDRVRESELHALARPTTPARLIFALLGVSIAQAWLLPLLAIGVPVTLALAAMSHHWIELPSSALAGRILSRHCDRERHQQHQPDAPRDH